MNNDKDTYVAFLNVITHEPSGEKKEKVGELLNKLLFYDEEVSNED